MCASNSNYADVVQVLLSSAWGSGEPAGQGELQHQLVTTDT